MKKRLIVDLLSILLLAGLMVVFFWPVIFKNKTFVTSGVILSDLINQNYPFKFVYAQLLKEGKLPFWSANIADGFPLLAEGQVGAFYPFNFLFFYFLPLLSAFNLSLVFHYFLAGVFSYLLARSFLRLSPLSALTSGLVFSFCGFMIAHLVHFNMVQTACWLPLQFWLLEKVIRKPNLWQAIPLSLVFTFQFLAGHVEIFYLCSLFLAGYLVARIFLSREKKRFWSSFFVLVVGGAMTVLLCSPQLLETWQLLKFSVRGKGYSFEESIGTPFPVRHLLTLVVPLRFDFAKEGFIPSDVTSINLSAFIGRKPYLWETYLYVGLVPLFFSLLALFFGLSKDKRVRTFSVILIISLFLAFGEAGPLFKFLWSWLPGMKLFRHPSRFLLFTQFSLALLAGLGLEEMVNKIGGFLRNVNIKHQTSNVVGFFLVMLVFLDLFLVQRRVNPVDDAQTWFEPPQTAEFLKENLGSYRYQTVGTANIHFETIKDLEVQKELRELLQPDFNLLYNLRSTNEQVAILLDRNIQLATGTPGIRLIFDEKGLLKVPDNLVRLLSLQSVMYFVSALPLENQNLVLAKEISLAKGFDYQAPQVKGDVVEIRKVPTKTIYIYENTQVLPRARMVYRVKDMMGKDEEEILEALVAEEFDSQNEVILEEELPVKLEEEGKGEAEIQNDEDDRVKIQVKSSGDGLLVLGDNFYPAWRAYVDSQPAKVYLANFSFRAVPIPSGKHTVEFQYQPWSLLR